VSTAVKGAPWLDTPLLQSVLDELKPEGRSSARTTTMQVQDKPTDVKNNFPCRSSDFTSPVIGFEAMLIDRSGGHSVEGRTINDLIRAIVLDPEFGEDPAWNCGLLRNALLGKFDIVGDPLAGDLSLYVQHPER
jgi:hypothetical protein